MAIRHRNCTYTKWRHGVRLILRYDMGTEDAGLWSSYAGLSASKFSRNPNSPAYYTVTDTSLLLGKPDCLPLSFKTICLIDFCGR